MAENSTSGSLGFIKDTKAGSSPNFSLTSSHFNVHATHGAISVAGGAMFDFEVAVEHLLNIEVGEGGEAFTRHVAVQITNVLEDTDLTDGNFIRIRTLEQLDCIRRDLDGDGVPSGDTMEQQAYRNAFGLAAGANHNCAFGCRGYRLVYDLDFDDADSYAGNIDSAWVDPASGGTPGTSGWVPIGRSGSPFTAIFDGNGHTISNLYINNSSILEVGLFGYTSASSEIRNLGLEHGSVTGGTGTYTYTGGLVGRNNAMIIASYATASVTGGTGTFTYTGGLVGVNQGAISASYATASVTGGTGSNNYTGGLVGNNNATIIASYATASVKGSATGNNAITGGLVGRNVGPIIASYATASVTGGTGTNTYTGGLVGINQGAISASYATASVTGGTGTYTYTGGLVGWNFQGAISASYATGDATGREGNTGGLVGINSGTITNSYYDSTVNAALNAIGFNDSDGTATNVSGKTTAELQAPTAYSTASDAMYYEWNKNIDGDLDTDAADIVWDFGTNIQRPVLRGIDANRDGIVDAMDLAAQRAAFPPSPPAALSVGTITPNSVLLSWTSYSDANTGFKVFYSETSAFNPAAPTPEGMEFVSVPALAPAATGVEVTGLSPSTTYYFRVAAVNGAVVGVYATAVPATTEAAMLTLLPAMLDFTAAGETKPVTITSNVEWTATSDMSWLTISGTAMGTGNGSISVVATEQAAAVGRTATITVETTGGLGRTVSVTQAAAVEALTLSDASLDFTAAGETKQLTITSNAEWTATSDMSWLTISGTTMDTGNGSISVVAAEQIAVVGRTATITVTAGALTQMVSISQIAAAAELSLSPLTLSFIAAGETKSVTITSNAEWTATSDMSWLTISGTTMDTGNGSISVVAAEQIAVVGRTATITVTAGALTQMVSVSQIAAAAELSLSPLTLSFIAAGETKSVTITSNAEWTATSDMSWLTISGTTMDTGNGSISVVATEQTAAVDRTATITVTAGALTQMVSVSQIAAAAELSLSPLTLSFIAAGETKSVTITSNAEWTATSDMSWLTISGTTMDTGNGSISVVATEQTAAVDRTATITVTAGALTQMVSVSQIAAAAELSLSPLTLSFIAAGETKSVTITSNAEWTATSDMSWLTISGTTMDTGNGSISVVATEQAAAVGRMATITITAGTLTRMLSISQVAAVAELSLSPLTLSFTAAGETKQLMITSNASWTVTSTATWLTLPTEGTEDEVIDVVAAEQTATVGRMATITVETTGGLMRTVSVTQSAVGEALVASLPLSALLRVPEGESTLLVYPNPTSDWVQVVGISSTRTYAYKVYSLVGQEVLSGNVHGDALIDISSFSDGQYIFILQGHGEEMRTRVLVLK